MENKENIQDKIDNYLLGGMSSEVLIAFEKEMAFSKELKESVELQKLIVSELKERASIFQLMKQVDKAEEKGILIKLQSWKFYAMAATVLILITLVIWQPGKLSNDEIVKQYAIAFPVIQLNDVYEERMRQDAMKNIDNVITRGDDCLYENLTATECKKIEEALAFYENGSFVEASIIFEFVLTPIRKNHHLGLYMSISQLKTGSLDKAINNFSYLIKIPDYQYQEDAKYFLALTYIQKGEIKKSRQILKTILLGSKYYQSRQEILGSMRWF